MLNVYILLIHLLLVSEPITIATPHLAKDLFLSNTIIYISDEDQVLQAEKSRFKAMVDGDHHSLDQIIHPDLVYIHSNGEVDTKETFISGIRDGSRKYDDITMEESQVRVYGEVGIINAKCTYHRTTPEGRANNLSLFYTSVYARIEGRWQHVSWQSYRLTE
jgi:ketosteroid isomerase-like protein